MTGHAARRERCPGSVGRVQGGGRVRREPWAAYSACQKRLRGEDVLFVREGRVLAQDGPSWSLYCVSAGHGGAAAANYVRRHLWKTLGPLLPSATLPDHDGQDFEEFAERCRVAVVKAFMKVGEQFRAEAPADTSGELGAQQHLMGEKNVTLPSSGARLLMGSRSLWDSMHWENAAQVTRRTPIRDAASTLIDLATLMGKSSVRQETSALVVDMVPPGAGTHYKRSEGFEWGRVGKRCVQCSRRVCLCGAPMDCGQSDEVEGVDVRIVAEVDGWDIIRTVMEEAHADSCSSMMMKVRLGLPAEQPRPAQNRRRAAGYSYPERVSVPRSDPVQGLLCGVSFRTSTTAGGSTHRTLRDHRAITCLNDHFGCLPKVAFRRKDGTKWLKRNPRVLPCMGEYEPLWGEESSW
eukprot:evm.model.scf_1459.2 EVM.evm.TU.scf_1459.2   scf_1459:10659-15753(+)